MKFRASAFLLSLFLLASPLAAAASLPEYQVKAAFVHSFGKYVIWPATAFETPSAAFIIGILGDDPFGDAFVALQQKNVQSRTLQIRRMATGSQARGCHILFISRSEQRRLPEILAAIRGQSILTISDMDDFAHRGGMIQLHLMDNQVRFQIGLRAAQEAGLTMSSNLLKLATAIVE